MHCRAEQVGVGRSLASRDKFLKFVGTIKKTKKKQNKESVHVAVSAYNSHTTQFGLVMDLKQILRVQQLQLTWF